MHLEDRTVVFGEASESESEEISLGNDEETVIGGVVEQDNFVSKSKANSLNHDAILNSHYSTSSRDDTTNSSSKIGGFGSSLFASIGSTTALAKLVSSYNILASNARGTPPISARGLSGAVIINPSRAPSENQLSLLHKTLYMRNQQLYSSLNHMFKHPYEKAFANLHSISQRLVGIQKTIQDVNSDVLKMKRELKNLDFKPKMVF